MRQSMAVVIAATGLTFMTGAVIAGTVNAGQDLIGAAASGGEKVTGKMTPYPPSSDDDTTTSEVAVLAPTIPTTIGASGGGAVAGTTVPAADLPATGGDSISSLQIGVVTALTGAGLVAVGATRRKRRTA